MGFLDGKIRILSIKIGGVFKPIGCLRSNPISESAEILETTTRASGGWRTGVVTKQFYNISFDGIQSTDVSGRATYKELREIKRSRELLEWRMSGDGQLFDTGFGHITEIGESNQIGEVLTFDGSIEGYGSPGETLGTGDLWQDGSTIIFQDGNSLIFN